MSPRGGRSVHDDTVALPPPPESNSNSPPAGRVTPGADTTAPRNGLMSDGRPPGTPTPSRPSMNRVTEAARPKPSGTLVALPSRRRPSVTVTPTRTVPPGKLRVVLVGRISHVGAIQRIVGWL